MHLSFFSTTSLSLSLSLCLITRSGLVTFSSTQLALRIYHHANPHNRLRKAQVRAVASTGAP
ncbi:MAG: hypothetical protein ACK41O_27130, partial [Runella zeae]